VRHNAKIGFFRPVALENRIRLLACGFVVASGGSAVFVDQPVQYAAQVPRIAAAIAAKYPGNRPRPLAVTIRDHLGGWLHDEDVAAAFGVPGRPGWPLSRLALVTALRMAEDLNDRQAAEAVPHADGLAVRAGRGLG
jgi:hypothetical protein